MNERQSLIKPVSAFLKQNKALLSDLKITAGFDGFVDTITRIIKEKNYKSVQTIDSVNDFTAYITAKAGTNFSLELHEMITKPGGNMPIMANALGCTGIKVNCIGALGFPVIHSSFLQLSPNCSLYSFADPGITTAIEFDDSKMLLAGMTSINNSNWQTIKDTIGIDKVISLFQQTNCIALLNWSEMDHATDIWKGVAEEVITEIKTDRGKPFIFIDLADCSKRSETAIREIISIIISLSTMLEVIVGLNANETRLIAGIFLDRGNYDDLRETGEQLYKELHVQSLIIHHSKQALAWDESGVYQQTGFTITTPKIFTGAGDNFNAGYCLGKLLRLKTGESLVLGHATAAYYIANGKSASIEELIDFLETNNE
jgi:hypothetical protein